MSPRTSQQFRDIREEKMTLIMNTALQHFANDGYFKTTISHIARHAGISKGLLYNYFESKEDLLNAIIQRSVLEIFRNLDIDRDGTLSEYEFEVFIRKIGVMLREKRVFWRLLIQLIMQNEARQAFLRTFPGSDFRMVAGSDDNYLAGTLRMFTEYFSRKKEKMSGSYDPETEFEMFTTTLKGFAIRIIFSDKDDEEINEKIIRRIIGQYK